MLITSKKIFIATSRLVFDQATGHDSLAKLTHKINNHISVPSDSIYFLEEIWYYFTLKWLIESTNEIM